MSTNLIILPNKHLLQPSPSGISSEETRKKWGLHVCSKTINSFIDGCIGLFPDAFIESTNVFIEHLLCTRPWTGYQGCSIEHTSTVSALMELTVSLGDSSVNS